MRIPLQFAGGTTTHEENIDIDDQYTVNYFPEIEGQGATSKLTLRPTPGLNRKFDAGIGPARSNGRRFNGNTYYVSGNKLIQISEDLTSGTEVGTLSTNGGRCSLAASPTELGIVDGTEIYRWDGTTFSIIADVDAPAGNTITWLDYYFICDVTGTGRFQISNLNDLTAWDALDYATAESSPDDLVAVYATSNELWLLGTETTEIYYNSGNPLFPFEPMGHGVLTVGTNSPHSVEQDEAGRLTWLSHYKNGGMDVVKASTGGIEIISDANIARKIGDRTDAANAYASSYGSKGHSFYILNFPDGTSPITIVYDHRVKLWHDRKSYNITRHRCAGVGIGGTNNSVLVFDYSSSTVYAWESDQHDDNGDMIERIRRMSILSNKGLPFTVDSIEFTYKAGVGKSAGSTPQVAMRYSKNGRKYNPDLTRSLGAIGEYNKRQKFGPLGRALHLHIETKVTSKNQIVVGDAWANIRSGYNA